MKLNNLSKILIILFSLSLVACNNNQPDAELNEFVKKIKARPPGQIEALPEIMPYRGLVYQGAADRNPFNLPLPKATSTVTKIVSGPKPDLHRNKEPLEFYSLDSLKMLGTIEKHGKRWAVVSDPENTIHRITVGNYLGMNHGKVIGLRSDRVDILELVSDINGRWREQKSKLVLTAAP